MILNRMRSSVPTKKTYGLMIAALALALLCGWGTLHFIDTFFYLGFPGAIAMMIVSGGPHGPNSHLQGVIGGVAFVIVNAVFYFFVFRFFVGRLPSNSD
jgi:hypothetical protein